ncbi:butyrophilin-like protein 8 [Scomber scombrus]|uniref:butyrophilin-like protein 8 n=1 Tax=Scomber scombrus TaxID=13677 RepID=UPI002DDBD65F|nr:butyrophilin-like protein 8 [Scomber scombrus]
MSMAVLASVIMTVLSSTSEDHQEVKVRPGQNATLQCQSPASTIRLLQWRRPDLASDGYVLFYRDKRSVQSFQLPSFHHRVQLVDPEMKNGDVSVILKNVTVNDSGTYECRVSANSKEHRKRATPETINTIVLKVQHSEIKTTIGEFRLAS